MRTLLSLLRTGGFPEIVRGLLETVQVNLGYRCNQRCAHCHVNAGPHRKEMMSRETVDGVLDLLGRLSVSCLDLTGGAPEMNPHFRYLVNRAREDGVKVIDRCNLTILQEPGFEDLAKFLASRQVEIVASLPCYLEDNVDSQRGPGVFGASLQALGKLNALGYGRQGSGLVLNLVYNPQGPALPPPQAELEKIYRLEMRVRYGIVFNRLYTLVNMPVQRFGNMLLAKGRFSGYMQLLREAHREENLAAVMCRSLISIGWDGMVFDCDFNQMLGLPLGGKRRHLREIAAEAEMLGQSIATADHCYGCTAGNGSSCGGALST